MFILTLQQDDYEIYLITIKYFNTE